MQSTEKKKAISKILNFGDYAANLDEVLSVRPNSIDLTFSFHSNCDAFTQPTSLTLASA